MDNLPDGRSPLAIAMQWVSQITTIAIEMVLPIVVGYWIDQRLGTKIVFTIFGVFLGFATGMWHLIKLSKTRIKP